MIATYVDVNEFTVTTDRTAEFINGRRIKADCGVNGIKYCTVLSSAFGAVTTVITKESELTVNLTTVLYGIVEPKESGSLPDHCHDGSEGSGGSALGTSGDVTFAQSIIVDEIRSDKAGGLRLGGYDVDYTDIDFTDPAWTEEDPNTRITVAADKVSWAALTKNENAWVVYDFTAGYFDGDFRHELEVKQTAADNGGWIFFWALTNIVDDMKGIDDASGDFIGLGIEDAAGSPKIELRECDGGSTYASALTGLTEGTLYYITVVRDENIGTHGTVYCYIYSDSGRTILLGKLEIALHSSKKDYRYLYACNTWNSGAAAAHTGYCENLRLSTDPFGVEKGIYVHDSGIVDTHMQSGCRVRLNGDQQLVAGNYHRLELDTEDYDIQNEWNSTTYRDTVIENGMYSVCATVYFIDTAVGDFMRLLIYINGASVAKAYEAIDSNGSVVLSMAFDLDVNDYIEIYVRDDATAAKAYAGHSLVSINKIA